MKKLVTPFKVGLLILGALLATVYMVSVLTRGEGWGMPDGYKVYATFDDATGLAENSRIKMSGLPVGRLEELDLEGDKVRVKMHIRDSVELYEGVEQPDGTWKNGATVERTQSSVIGDYYLEVTPGTEGDRIGEGGEIRNVVTSPGANQIMARFDRIAGDIETVTRSLSAVFGDQEGEETLEQMLGDLQQMLKTMRGFVDKNSMKIDRILGNVEGVSADMEKFASTGTRSLQRIMSDAEQVVQEVKYIVGQSSGEVKAGLGTLRGTLGRLQTTLDSLNYSLQNIQDITDKVNEGKGSLGRVVNNNQLVRRAERILGDVENLTGRVDEMQAVIDLRTEYHFRHQRMKNVLGLRLQPNENKYYLAEFVDGYRGKTSIVQEDINTTNADAEDGQFRRTTVTTTNDFKLSFQLARSKRLTEWAKVTGRFGIIESSGGIGGNLVLLNDGSLEVQADVFQFGLNDYPRVRGFLTWDFVEFAYVHGGIDDALNPRQRDYFIGAGIQFNDDDLKALISTTGIPTPE